MEEKKDIEFELGKGKEDELKFKNMKKARKQLIYEYKQVKKDAIHYLLRYIALREVMLTILQPIEDTLDFFGVFSKMYFDMKRESEFELESIQQERDSESD